MKRLLAIFVTLLLLLSCAHAEAFDLSGMSDDDLLALNDQITSEIANRGLNSSAQRTLREGKYVIGSDIRAGTYKITCIATSGESVGNMYDALGGAIDATEDSNGMGSLFGMFGNIAADYIDCTVEIVGDYGDVLNSYTMKTDDSFTITLEEGTALKISDGSCTITPN